MVNEANKKIVEEILERMATVKEGLIMLDDIDYAVLKFMFEDANTEVSLEYAGLIDDTVVYMDITENGSWCAVRFRPEADPDLLEVVIRATIELVEAGDVGEVNKLSLDLHIKRKKIMRW